MEMLSLCDCVCPTVFDNDFEPLEGDDAYL